MADHLEALGFHVENSDQFESLALTALGHGSEVESPSPHWRTVCWDLDGGPSLWVHVSERETIECFTPMLRSQESIRLFVANYFEDPECLHCSGLVLENRGGVDDGEALYPLAIQVPNILAVRRAVPAGGSHEVRMTAIGESVEIYSDRRAFEAFHGKMGHTPDVFLPIGLVGSEPVERVQATAIISGTVLAAETRKNPHTGLPWHWARIETAGLVLDAAIPKSAGSLRSENFVRGTFWLAGLLETTPYRGTERPSGWSRILGTGRE